jgi:cation:H+ antiporter
VLTLLALDGVLSRVDGVLLLAAAAGYIALTVVAIGTSAPEIVIAAVATIRGERDVAVGNLIGSSVYDVVVILGLTCLVPPHGVLVDRHVLVYDLPLMTGVAALCVPVFVSGRRVSRVEGALFVAGYVAYLIWIVAVRA